MCPHLCQLKWTWLVITSLSFLLIACLTPSLFFSVPSIPSTLLPGHAQITRETYEKTTACVTRDEAVESGTAATAARSRATPGLVRSGSPVSMPTPNRKLLPQEPLHDHVHAKSTPSVPCVSQQVTLLLTSQPCESSKWKKPDPTQSLVQRSLWCLCVRVCASAQEGRWLCHSATNPQEHSSWKGLFLFIFYKLGSIKKDCANDVDECAHLNFRRTTGTQSASTANVLWNSLQQLTKFSDVLLMSLWNLSLGTEPSILKNTVLACLCTRYLAPSACAGHWTMPHVPLSKSIYAVSSLLVSRCGSSCMLLFRAYWMTPVRIRGI